MVQMGRGGEVNGSKEDKKLSDSGYISRCMQQNILVY